MTERDAISLNDSLNQASAAMSLRDAFALGALPGLVEFNGPDVQWVAVTAYQIADAMLQERQKGGAE